MSASKFVNFARASLFVLFGAVATTASYAHHSFGAEFDSTKPIKLQGVVTRLEWTNPHVYLWVDSKDAKTGKVTQWGFEMGPPHMLQKAGWKKNSLTLGEIGRDRRLARARWQQPRERAHGEAHEHR